MERVKVGRPAVRHPVSRTAMEQKAARKRAARTGFHPGVPGRAVLIHLVLRGAQVAAKIDLLVCSIVTVRGPKIRFVAPFDLAQGMLESCLFENGGSAPTARSEGV